ncbi:hypothetical protein UlMin_016701 [Ulmus minor]
MVSILVETICLMATGKIDYALVRPPGHHAQPTQADRYCSLNNAGIAVHLALNSGCEKVAVVDIYVHYGNGTAQGFYESNKVLTISLHMNHGSWGPHPQSGAVDELGDGEGFGYNLNMPLPNGTGDRGYGYAMTELVVPAIEKFEPDMMVLVVGQDSSAIISSLAKKHSARRLLIVQEGGYHVTYSAYCLHAIINKALEEFEAEIAVLSRVRHRHYFLPQGALSRHLFHWKSLNLQPLSWTQRLIIALDVARGIEY